VNEPVATLVLDEPLAALRADLERHGVSARTVADFRLTSPLDPDVLRAVSSGMGATPWVLVTTNATIPDEHRSFEWERYAIAWIVVDPDLGGIAVEQARADVVLRHRDDLTRQRPGDLFTYTRFHRHRAPPSLGSTLRRSSPSYAGRRRGG
jgi:hypothetical protein